MNFQAASDVAIKWISVLAAIAGGIYGLMEFTELNRKRVDERKLQTLAYARDFAGQDYFDIRRSVYRHFIECSKDCDEATLDNSQAFAFVEFFDIVYACVDAKTCDEGLARDFFTPYANGHWHCMKDFIMKTRQAEPDSTTHIPFGKGLDFFKTWEKPIGRCALKPPATNR